MKVRVIESIRIHESWSFLAKELVKWGEFARAKEIAKEASIHSRILKDPDSYTRSLLVLSQIALIEGDSGSALKIAMAAQQSVREMQ